MPSANDYRLAGRRHQQDKRRREQQATIEAAEETYDEAAETYRNEPIDTPGRPAWAAFQQARDALYDLDPTNYRFS